MSPGLASNGPVTPPAGSPGPRGSPGVPVKLPLAQPAGQSHLAPQQQQQQRQQLQQLQQQPAPRAAGTSQQQPAMYPLMQVHNATCSHTGNGCPNKDWLGPLGAVA
jgi:hypothetical protein